MRHVIANTIASDSDDSSVFCNVMPFQVRLDLCRVAAAVAVSAIVCVTPNASWGGIANKLVFLLVGEIPYAYKPQPNSRGYRLFSIS